MINYSRSKNFNALHYNSLIKHGMDASVVVVLVMCRVVKIGELDLSSTKQPTNRPMIDYTALL